jgi:hypothetical protein
MDEGETRFLINLELGRVERTARVVRDASSRTKRDCGPNRTSVSRWEPVAAFRPLARDVAGEENVTELVEAELRVRRSSTEPRRRRCR